MQVKKAGWWLATISALGCLLPFAGVIAGSLRYPGPLPVTLEQYGRALLQNMEFYTGFWNSLLNTALILLINIPVSLLAGYGFSQYRFPGRNALYWLYVAENGAAGEPLGGDPALRLFHFRRLPPGPVHEGHQPGAAGRRAH